MPEETLVEAYHVKMGPPYLIPPGPNILKYHDSDVQIDHYLTVGHVTKELNIIDLLIIFAERRDDYFPSYRCKTIFWFSSALIYS